jgi:hypothetical protein
VRLIHRTPWAGMNADVDHTIAWTALANFQFMRRSLGGGSRRKKNDLTNRRRDWSVARPTRSVSDLPEASLP